MQLIAFSLAMIATFLWGLSQVLGKLALRELNATIFNIVRFLSVFLALTPLILASGLKFSGTDPIILSIVSGVIVFFGAGQTLFYSMKRAPAHIVIPIANSTPVWVLIMASLLGESIAPLLPFSVGMVFVGAFLLVPREKGFDLWRPAILLALLSAIIWSIGQFNWKAAMNTGLGVTDFLWVSSFLALICLTSNASIAQSWKVKLSRRSLALSVFSGVTGQLIGNFCYLTAFQFEKVSTMAPLYSTPIVFGFLFSILLVGERPTKKAMVGMVLIFSGVFLAAL